MSLSYLLSEHWAMEPKSLEKFKKIVIERGSEAISFSEVESLYEKKGYPLERVKGGLLRGSTAIIPVCGPIFPKSNIMTELCGATSTQQVLYDVQEAVKNPRVKTILLDMDTPGGAVTGTNDLSNYLYELRGKKRLVAYVSGFCASAGYWIGSAMDAMVCNEIGMVGSIGVVATYNASSDTIDVVSSQSPNKRPDVKTEQGQALVRENLDKIASIFIGCVARNRGVTEKKVLKDFKQGGLEVGQDAVEAGMVDGVMGLEELLSKLEVTSGLEFLSSSLKGKEESKGIFSLFLPKKNKIINQDLEKESTMHYDDIKSIVEDQVKYQSMTLKSDLERAFSAANSDLVGQIQSLKAENKELQDKNNSLESRLTSAESEIKKLKNEPVSVQESTHQYSSDKNSTNPFMGLGFFGGE